MESEGDEDFLGEELENDGAKNEKDMLAMERDAKFNAWLQRKAILDNAFEYLKLLDSNRGKDRDQTIDIAVSLLAVDRLLRFSSKNVETTMMTVKASLEAKKERDKRKAEEEAAAAAAARRKAAEAARRRRAAAGEARAKSPQGRDKQQKTKTLNQPRTEQEDTEGQTQTKSLQGLPLAVPWRPGGLRKPPGRMPTPLVSTYLSVAAKKGETRITVNYVEGCMKGMWVQVGEGTVDLCKIASSTKIASSSGSNSKKNKSKEEEDALSVLELYKREKHLPGLHQDHPVDTVVNVYTSDNWKTLMDLSTSADAREMESSGAMTKSMKQVWMKWTMEHHTLHDVVLAKEDVAKLSEGAREGIDEETDEKTGVKKQVFLSLKYSFPKGYKPQFLTKREEEKKKKQEKKQKKDKKDDGPPKKKTKEEIEAEEQLKKRGGLTQDAVVKNELFTREIKKMWAEAAEGFRGLVEAGVKELETKRKKQAEEALADAKNKDEKTKGGGDEKEDKKKDKEGGDSESKGGSAAAAKGKDGSAGADSKSESKTTTSGKDKGADLKGGAGEDKDDKKEKDKVSEGGDASKSKYEFTGSKLELFTLHELALKRLKEWADEDEDAWMVEEQKTKKEEEDEWKTQYRSYVTKKDKIRIRLPDPADLDKLPKPNLPPMEFRAQVVPRAKSAPVGVPSTLDILAHSGLKYVYAHHGGIEIDKARGDLERCRQQLIDSGLLYIENFDDERKYKKNKNGEYLDDGFRPVELSDLTKYPLSDFHRKKDKVENERSRRIAKEKEESTKAYTEWVEVKALKDAAVRALDLLHPPSLPFGYKEFLDATSKARRAMMEEKDFQLVVGVGQALKKVDRTLLKEYAKWCTKITSPKPQPGDPGFTGNEAKQPSPTFFPSFNVVQALWDAFEPAACDVHSAAYSQVRDAFLKIMRPGLDYRLAFYAFADKWIKKKVEKEMEKTRKTWTQAGEEEEERLRLYAKEQKVFALSKDQMKKLLSEMGVEMGDIEMGQLIDAFDANGDGEITLEEFLEFTGPKREKGGGTLLAINTRAACCWHTTCKVTSMPNAYADVAKVHLKKGGRGGGGAAASSSSGRGRGGSGRDDDDVDRRDRDREDSRDPRRSRGNNYDDDDHNETKDDSSHHPRGSTASLSLTSSARGSNGPKKVMRRIAGGGTGKEVREQFEMPDRARREDMLVKFGVIPSPDDRDEYDESDNDRDDDEDYDDDDFDRDGDRSSVSKKKKRTKKNSCGIVLWTLENRKKGLKYLVQASKNAQEEVRIKQMINSGSPPQAPRLWDGTEAPHVATEVKEWACTELLVNWGPAHDHGDFITFFSLEFGGPVGNTATRANYRKVARDPVDAEPDSDFTFAHLLNDLQPGTSYAFRIRAFNGYGPGEYTYKVLTTRPAKVRRPKVTCVTNDSVTLRWQFPPLFLKRSEELERLFTMADDDRSGKVDRGELTAILTSSVKASAFPDLLSFLRQRAKTLGLDLSQRGLGALFDMMEGDDDGMLSWTEFEGFFMGAGWGTYLPTGSQAPTSHGSSSSSVVAGVEGGGGDVRGSMSMSGGEGAMIGAKGRPGDIVYVVERCLDDHRQQYREVLRTSLGHATVHRLEPGAPYKFRIHAVNVDGRPGPASPPVIIQTHLETPPPPTVMLASISAQSVSLKWKKRHDGQSSKDATVLKRLCDDWVGVGYGGENEGDGGVSIDKAFSKFCGDRDELTADLFGELLEHLGVEANDERMREAFYGTERPEVISFAEFMTWWLRNEATYIVKRSDPIPRDDPNAHTKSSSSGGLATAPVETRMSGSYTDEGGVKKYRLAAAEPRPSSAGTYNTSRSTNRLLQPTASITSANAALSLAQGKKPPKEGAEVSVAMPWVSYRGPGTKCEIAGLQPNTLYHFKLRFTSCRSHSSLSHPLLLMTAPAAPQLPPVVTSPVGMNTVRVKMYPPETMGAFKFLLQLKKTYGPSGKNNPKQVIGSLGAKTSSSSDSQGNSSSSSSIRASSRVDLQDDLLMGGRVAANGEGYMHDDGWTTVYYGHSTLWVSTTLASESDYECRYFAVNVQGCVSAPSPVLSFTTLHRTSTAVEQLMSPKHAAHVFTVECTGDICVGDTVVMTERLYYKDQRFAEDQGLGQGPGLAETFTPGGFIGERTIAAYVVKDNYRSSRNAIEAMGLSPRDVRKFSQHRKLWLEVVWQRNSHEACRPYDLKVGSVIERDQSHLEEFEVFRCPWPADMERLRKPLYEEWAKLKECYY